MSKPPAGKVRRIIEGIAIDVPEGGFVPLDVLNKLDLIIRAKKKNDQIAIALLDLAGTIRDADGAQIWPEVTGQGKDKP